LDLAYPLEITRELSCPRMRQAVTVSLAPAGNAAELRAIEALLQEMTALELALPGDPSRRRLRLRLHT
jgi:hypothetical protein